jgi:hypothetical protein
MMCILEVPAVVLNYIDRVRRHCLWRNSDCNDKTKPLVTWNKCTKLKKKRGMCITNLRSQNSYLRIKHLDKFFNHKVIPWVRMVWSSYYTNGKLPQSSNFVGSFW